MLKVGFYPFRGPDASSTLKQSYHYCSDIRQVCSSGRVRTTPLSRTAAIPSSMTNTVGASCWPHSCASVPAVPAVSQTRGVPDSPEISGLSCSAMRSRHKSDRRNCCDDASCAAERATGANGRLLASVMIRTGALTRRAPTGAPAVRFNQMVKSLDGSGLMQSLQES